MFSLLRRNDAAKTAETEDGKADQVEAEAVVAIQAKWEYGSMVAARLSDPDEDHASQLARYERIRDECIAHADDLEDEFYRGAAIHRLIDMCVLANDLAVARALLLAVRDEFIRERILKSAPMLARP